MPNELGVRTLSTLCGLGSNLQDSKCSSLSTATGTPCQPEHEVSGLYGFAVDRAEIAEVTAFVGLWCHSIGFGNKAQHRGRPFCRPKTSFVFCFRLALIQMLYARDIQKKKLLGMEPEWWADLAHDSLLGTVGEVICAMSSLYLALVSHGRHSAPRSPHSCSVEWGRFPGPCNLLCSLSTHHTESWKAQKFCCQQLLRYDIPRPPFLTEARRLLHFFLPQDSVLHVVLWSLVRSDVAHSAI